MSDGNSTGIAIDTKGDGLVIQFARPDGVKVSLVFTVVCAKWMIERLQRLVEFQEAATTPSAEKP